MKLECVKELLISGISKAEKITSKNPTLPVLKCILLQAKGDVLYIKATNLELGIETKIPAKIETEGTTAVPASILTNFLNQIQDNKHINLEVIDSKLHIHTGSSSTTINCFSYDDFPNIPIVTEEKSFNIPSQDLVNGFKSVVYCASVSSIKPELTSVLVVNDEDNLVFVATDSFRLAEKKIRVKKSIDIGQILIPHKSVLEVVRIIGDSREDVLIMFNKNQISFTVGGTYITSRVIDGVFPDYKQIIPKSFTTELIVLKQDLISNLKLTNVFTDAFHQVVFNVNIAKKIFEIRTKNNEVGESSTTVQSALSGENITSSFNYKYIMDCFQSITVDSVSLQFNGVSRPMLIRGVSDSSFTYLVMSMNK